MAEFEETVVCNRRAGKLISLPAFCYGGTHGRSGIPSLRCNANPHISATTVEMVHVSPKARATTDLTVDPDGK